MRRFLARMQPGLYASVSVFPFPDSPPPFRRTTAPLSGRLGSVFVFSLLTMGCSVAAEEADGYDGVDEVGTTHAVVRIQKTETSAGASRGDALVGFVQIPASADLEQILVPSGLAPSLPRKGECWSGETPRPDESWDGTAQAELLQADSVRLVSDSGSQSLAPYAFPTVADLLRGVVYLSRDRSADPFGSGVYTVVGKGVAVGNETIDLESEHTSPPAISALAINGEPWSASMPVTAGPVMDLSWNRSESDHDAILVTLEGDVDVLTCSFADAEGFGSVPLVTEDGAVLGTDGREALLSVHRIRTTSSHASGGVAQLNVTFDFAVETDIRFSGTR